MAGIITNPAWTMIAWCKFRSSVGFKTGFRLFDGVDDSAATCMVSFYYDTGNWIIESTGTYPISPTAVGSATSDTWYMLALNSRNTGAGAPRYRYSINGSAWTTIGPAAAGARAFNGLYLYDSVDEVQIYEDTDDFPVDLAALYNSGSPSEFSSPYPSTLQYYWKLNDSVVDAIGTQNLTLTPSAGSYGVGILNGDVLWNNTSTSSAYYGATGATGATGSTGSTGVSIMNPDVSDVVVSGVGYTKKDGRLVLQAQLTNFANYQTINPPVAKGYTPNEFYTHMTSRLDRPRYYYSTPSGLQY